MKHLLMVLALALAACAPRVEPDLNPMAEAYVRLVLEIGTHEDGYIDAYYGPPELREAAEADPRDIDALKADADALHADLEAALRAAHDAGVQRRARTLAAYVASARFRLDMIEGARVPFADEAERLFALRPVLRPLSSFDPALERLEALVPGEGPLADRLQAFNARYAIPPDRLRAVMDAAIAECRRRTLAHIELPEDESFELEFVSGQSWAAYNWYRGDHHSLIQVNTDRPIDPARAIDLGCHEGYPGHHVQGINNERMFRERGWVEYSVAPLFSPQGPLQEGGGNYGVELAFPGDEQLAFEQATLFPLAGLDPATAPQFEAVRRAMLELGGASLKVQQMYLDGEVDRAGAIELLRRYALRSREAAAANLDFADHYRSYVINYSTGEDLVRAYIERAGADPAARWAAYQSIISQPTLPADLQ